MHYLAAHAWILGALGGSAGTWLFSIFVASMPPIPPESGYWARWAYSFLQLAAANLDKVKDGIKPPLK